MFDKEFYPTPESVLEIIPIDCYNKTVLEPSAGKGDIVDYLIKKGAKKVISVEKNEELRQILTNKCLVIGEDFFNVSSEQISHIQLIVMNPPFSNAHKHIEHAFDIAPEGCEIISLCNYETINKDYIYGRLSKLITDYGLYNNLGNCFDTAERKTNIEIGLVRLFKPVVSEGQNFEGFFMEEDEEDTNTTEGLMPHDEVRALVQRYVGAMKTFDKMYKNLEELKYTTNALGMKDYTLKVGYNNEITTREDFSKHLQIVSWNHIINVTGIRKFTTSLMMQDINKFVENQVKYPFTMKNVYQMLNIIVQTRKQQFDKALVASVDAFTQHIKDNRFGVEGWVTNSGHMINQKIIIPNLFERGWNNAEYIEVRYNANYLSKIDDLAKVMCMLCGYSYDEMNGSYIDNEGNLKYNSTGLYSFTFNNSKRLQTSTWYDWGFFEFKGFYKGTMHIRFKNNEDWYRLNQAYGELKGFTVPENL